eukprot:2504714-Rhodomonas_salina.6
MVALCVVDEVVCVDEESQVQETDEGGPVKESAEQEWLKSVQGLSVAKILQKLEEETIDNERARLVSRLLSRLSGKQIVDLLWLACSSSSEKLHGGNTGDWLAQLAARHCPVRFMCMRQGPLGVRKCFGCKTDDISSDFHPQMLPGWSEIEPETLLDDFRCNVDGPMEAHSSTVDRYSSMAGGRGGTDPGWGHACPLGLLFALCASHHLVVDAFLRRQGDTVEQLLLTKL